MSQRQAVSEELKNMNQSDLDMRLLAAFRANNMDDVHQYYNHYANIHTHLRDIVKFAIQHNNDDMVDFISKKAKKLDTYQLRDLLVHAVDQENWMLAEKLVTDHRQTYEKERYFYTGEAEKGNVALLRFCHNHAFNIRGDDDYIVKCAAGAGQLEVLKFLIEDLGADARARDDEAFGAACSHGCIETAEYLRQQGCKIKSRDNYPVWTAAYSGHLDVLEYLHDLGLPLNKSRRGDNAPFLDAVKQGHTHIVKYMHEHGVDIDRHNGQALAAAACNGDLNMIKTLVELGANIHVRDYEWQKENKTTSKLKDVFKKWVMRKTDENEPTYFGEYTALACAARGHYADVFDYLLEQGADIYGNAGQAIHFAMDDYYDLERKRDPKLRQAQYIINKIISLDPGVLFNERFGSIKNYYFRRTDVADIIAAYPPENVNYDQANMMLATAASDYNWPLAKALIENYDVDINVDSCGLIRQALRDDPVSQHMNGNRVGNRDMLHYLIEAGADTSLIEEQQPKLLFDFNRQDIEEAQEQRAIAQKEAAAKREAQAKEQRDNSLKSMGQKKPISMKKRR